MAVEQELLEHQQIIHAVFEAQRAAVRKLHDGGSISDALLRRIERDLDLEELSIMANLPVSATCQPSSQRSGDTTI